RRLGGSHIWIRSVAFAPDGKTLMSAGFLSKVSLWEVKTGKVVRRFPGQVAALSSDGKVLVTADNQAIYVYDPATGKQRRRFAGLRGLNVLALTADGQTLATAGRDRRVRLWDTATGEEQRQLGKPQGVIASLMFSPNGKTLAVGYKGGVVALWDFATGKEQFKFAGHRSWVFAVAFAPNGKSVASGGWHEGVRLWDARTGRERRHFL